MGNLSNFVKRIRDVMRNDAGINGDAQRIEQIAWMLFLKVYDAKRTIGYGMKVVINLFFQSLADGAIGRMMKTARA